MFDAAQKRLKLFKMMVVTEIKNFEALKEKAAASRIQAHMKFFSISLADANPDMQIYLRPLLGQVLTFVPACVISAV